MAEHHHHHHRDHEGAATVTADAQLAKMGYKAELPRNLSMMSILGL